MEKLPVTNRLRGTYMFIAGLFLLSCLVYFLISSSFKKSSIDITAKIFGRKVSADEFNKIYESQRVQFISQFGELYDSFKPMIDVEQETFNTLILLEEAKHRGIKVTNQEVIDYISQFNVFFRQNKFDTALYRNFLREKFHTNPQVFEENIRHTLVMKKLFTEVTSSVTIDEKAILKTYMNKQNKAQISYTRIPFAQYKEQAAKNISDAEIEKFYKDSISDYFFPPTIQLQYIKLKFPEDGGVQKEVEIKFKAKAIVEEFNKGTNFKDLGNKYKFPAVETSFFSKDNPPDIGLNREMISEAFRTAVNTISLPIELSDGYLVYHVMNKKPAHQGSLDEAKEMIKASLIDQKARALALEESKKVRAKLDDALKNNPDNREFSAICGTLGIKITQSTLDQMDNLYYTLNIDEAHAETFLDLNAENSLSIPLPTADTFLIVHVDKFEKTAEILDEKKTAEVLEKELDVEKDKAWQNFTKELVKEAHLEISYP